MKKVILLMAMLMVWTLNISATSDKGSKDKDVPKIEFKSRSHDFGTINEKDGKVTCEFTFTNTGKAPLVIISAIARCGCTSPAFDERPIAPGKSSSIKVTYNPKGRPGEFVKNVTVKTNDPKNKKVNLVINGVVVPN